MASPVVGTAKVKILPDFAGFNQAYGAEMKKHFGNFASRQLAATGQDMTNAISKPLFGFFKDGLKVASDFYTTVGELSAIMAEKTGESYGKFAANQVTFMKDGQQVKDSFVTGLREIARESKFSVDEMGQASTALARTGVRSQQEMIDFLSISQRVAAANREELVATTEEMRTLSQVFNTGSGPGQISHIGDVITTVLTTSNMDLATFTEGMKRAGPVANSLGLSIEDTASSIGVLGNVGFKGSTASTALKNAMIRLRSDIPAVTDVLKKYGIQTEKANGKSIPLVNVLEQMHDAGINTSDAFKVFGQVGGPAMSALLSPSNIEKVKLLTENMKDMQGVTDRLYERMKETPEFKMEALSSNFEELKLTVVDNFFPTFTNGLDSANNAVTTFITMFQGLPDPIKKVTLALGAALIAAGPIAIVFGKVGQSAGILKTAFTSLVPSMGAAYLAVGAQLDGLGARMVKFVAATRLGNIMGYFTGATTGVGIFKRSLLSLMNVGGKALTAIGEKLFEIAQSGPAMAGIAVVIAGIGYAWYKSNEEAKKAKELQDLFSKQSVENLSKNVSERKNLSELYLGIIQDESNSLGEILHSGDYQKGLTEYGITYQQLADRLSKGGSVAIETLTELGNITSNKTDSGMEKFWGGIVSDDTLNSINRFQDAAKLANLEILNNGGEYEKGLKEHYLNVKKIAEENGTEANRVLEIVKMDDLSDEEVKQRLGPYRKYHGALKAYKTTESGLLSEVKNGGKDIADAWLVQTDKLSEIDIYSKLNEYMNDNQLVRNEILGTMKDITTATSADIKDLTVEQIQAQMMASEEIKQAQADLAKNQDALGIGANVTGFEELSTSEKEALPIMNALIASGQDLGQSLSYLQKMTGITMPRAIELSNIKLEQMKGYIDRAKQSLPQLGNVMSTFTEENPPTMAKAIDALSKKYLDFATAQSKMRQLLQFNGGEFTALYEELATLPADQQLQLVKNLEFTPDQLATLREQQTALITAKTTAGAEGVMGAAAAAAANNSTGVTLLDPISKAFSDLSKEISDSAMTPTISPQLDPAFVGYWNMVTAKIKSLDPITSQVTPPRLGTAGNRMAANELSGGRASGGPVWPGLKTKVNELGREGFVNSSGRFSMLPNTSSMKFNEYGTVIPAHMVGGSRGGVTVVNHNNISGVTAQEVAEYQSSLTQAQVRRLGGGL